MDIFFRLLKLWRFVKIVSDGSLAVGLGFSGLLGLGGCYFRIGKGSLLHIFTFLF